MINTEIILLCSKYLGFGSESLDEAYRDINDSIIHSTISDKNIVFPKKELSFINSEHFFLTGIDLPILLSGNHNLTLMIVGSEPLRNEKFFLANDIDPYNEMSVGTPYSYHTEVNVLKTNVYTHIINGLKSQANIYLTDLRKVWFAGFEYNSNFIKDNRHKNFLLEELETINPNYVITFGNESYIKVQHLLKESQRAPSVIPLMHPSPRNFGSKRNDYFLSNNIDITKFKNSGNNNLASAMAYIEIISSKIKFN
jgi:hypothetical protein